MKRRKKMVFCMLFGVLMTVMMPLRANAAVTSHMGEGFDYCTLLTGSRIT